MGSLSRYNVKNWMLETIGSLDRMKFKINSNAYFNSINLTNKLSKGNI